MLIYKTLRGVIVLRGRNDTYGPPVTVSRNWKHWKSAGDERMCKACGDMHGKIWPMEELPDTLPPLHPNCRCVIRAMDAVAAGSATKDGENGADQWLKNYGRLPDYYIAYEEISELGWKKGKSPVKYAPGRMITMGEYQNKNGHLPDAPGREWQEADINYNSGRRNGHRVVWSNDGLIFVTYDHYQTFLEIVGGN